MFKICMLASVMLLPGIAYTQITIRPAQQDDLEAILELDRIVSYEYFKPLFLTYTGLILSEQADALLKEDLTEDRSRFLNGINHLNHQRLLVACDKNAIVGFASYQKEETNIHINLICIKSEYRNKKIGVGLLDTALGTFIDTRSCTLLVLDKNIAARRMYEAYGFKVYPTPDEIKQELPVDAAHIYVFYRLELSLAPNAHK